MHNLPFIFQKSVAFLRKDFLNESSYKFSFVSHFAGILFSVLSMFFLSRLVGDAAQPYLSAYGGDYFSFVIIGVALAGYMQVALGTFSGSIREAQVTGTLEAMVATRTGAPVIILFSSIYSFAATTVRIFIYLLFGAFAFGLHLSQANYAGALLILCLTIICFSSIGILSASFILILKRGDPFNWIFTSLSWLLGGIYYPITVLPEWLQKISYLFPITHALEGIRLALLQGYPTRALFSSICPLLGFGLVMIPASIGMFRHAIRIAKMNGSLTQY
ncbi:MAG: ABC transporter permease [Desulfobacteraceae bacterium]|nr:MAG: ABC transporter permease [Desulfobacteraceae bacterium]